MDFRISLPGCSFWKVYCGILLYKSILTLFQTSFKILIKLFIPRLLESQIQPPFFASQHPKPHRPFPETRCAHMSRSSVEFFSSVCGSFIWPCPFGRSSPRLLTSALRWEKVTGQHIKCPVVSWKVPACFSSSWLELDLLWKTDAFMVAWVDTSIHPDHPEILNDVVFLHSQNQVEPLISNKNWCAMSVNLRSISPQLGQLLMPPLTVPEIGYGPPTGQS